MGIRGVGQLGMFGGVWHGVLLVPEAWAAMGHDAWVSSPT
jgi:hypothetical protein